MIAPNEDVTAAGSGETAPTTTTTTIFFPPPMQGMSLVALPMATDTAPDAPTTPAPTTAPADPTTAPSKPRWAPDQKQDGTPFPPASYARSFGDTPEGLVQWAELNQTHLGIPGEYNAAVLFQAAGRLTERCLALGMIAAQLKVLRAVFNGESLKNASVREAFEKAIEVIADETAGFAPLTSEEIEAAKIDAPESVPGLDKIETETGPTHFQITETATPATLED